MTLIAARWMRRTKQVIMLVKIKIKANKSDERWTNPT